MIAAALAGLASANVPAGFQMPAECFGKGAPVATTRATDRKAGPAVSNAEELLSDEWDPSYRVTSIKHCADNYNRIIGVQLSLTNERGEVLTLDPIGDIS